ncbi:MAG: exodeoxyribonuclease III [Fusobacteria bacterium]|nr:exodeoxyribonuclease III [Fusobacteriota bacterium]
MKLISWNVNGIRAVYQKGFIEWVLKENPDILCIQETKAQEEQLDDNLKNILGYKSYFSSAKKKGYSGVAIYTKDLPLNVKTSNIENIDNEGRILIAEYKDFILINCYFPNSQEAGKRLEYKLEFCNNIIKISNKYVSDGKKVIITGDYNIAHNEIDLTNPKSNEKNPGFLKEERDWMSYFLNEGYIDTYRYFYPDTVKYSWWSYRLKARERNVGWRIDYFCVSKNMIKDLVSANIDNDTFGSDHCPVAINIK